MEIKDAWCGNKNLKYLKLKEISYISCPTPPFYSCDKQSSEKISGSLMITFSLLELKLYLKCF